MAFCRRCNAIIRWGKDGPRWVPFNMDGTPHHDNCSGSSTCRLCESPVKWEADAEGRKRCLDIDGRPHSETCTRRDECAHCWQKVKWTLVDSKWLMFDALNATTLHWESCPKNPTAARRLMKELASLRAEAADRALGRPPPITQRIIDAMATAAERSDEP